MSPGADADVLVSARLMSEQSLAVFRAVLDAASRPGKLVSLPTGVATGVPPALVPALALADLDVSVATLEHDDPATWQSSMRSVTGCQLATMAEADMIVALRVPTAGEVRSLRTGTAHAPERGARLFVACSALAEGRSADGTRIRVSGPGASNGRAVSIGGVDPDVFVALAAANRSFPAGVDTWLVAADGAMTGMPRSAHIEVLEGND